MAQTGMNLNHANDQLMALERSIREQSQPQEIMEQVCHVLTMWFEFVGFFHVKGPKAIGWLYRGQTELDDLNFEEIVLDLTQLPALKNALENQVMAQLDPIEIPAWQTVWQARRVSPKPALALPVRIGPRVPFMLYADFSKRPDAVVIGLINQTIGVLGMRLEQIILEKRRQKAEQAKQAQTTPATGETQEQTPAPQVEEPAQAAPMETPVETTEQPSPEQQERVAPAQEMQEEEQAASIQETEPPSETSQKAVEESIDETIQEPGEQSPATEPSSTEDEDDAGELTPDMLSLGEMEDPFASTSPTQPELEAEAAEPGPSESGGLSTRWVDQLKSSKQGKVKTRSTISAPSLLPAGRKGPQPIELSDVAAPSGDVEPPDLPDEQPSQPSEKVAQVAKNVEPGMTPPPELALRDTLSDVQETPHANDTPEATQVISVLRDQNGNEDKPIFAKGRRERKTFTEMRATVAEEVKQRKYDQPQSSEEPPSLATEPAPPAVPNEEPPAPPVQDQPIHQDTGIELVSAQETQAEQVQQYKRKTFVEMAIFDPEIQFDSKKESAQSNRTRVTGAIRGVSRATMSAFRAGNEPPPPPSPFDELVESNDDYLGEEVRKRTETLILDIPADHPIPVGRFPEPYTLPDGHIVVNLLHMGDHGKKKLYQMLQQDDPRHRYLGVLAFVYHFDAAALEHLAPLLFDRELHIAEMSLRLLKYYRNTAEFRLVSDEVLMHLEDENDALLDDAIGYCGELRILDAIDQLINLMNNKSLKDACVGALQKITFQPIGDSPSKWRRWYDKNADKSEWDWALRALTGREVNLAQQALRELETMSGKRMGHFDLTQRKGRQQAHEAWRTYWETEKL